MGDDQPPLKSAAGIGRFGPLPLVARGSVPPRRSRVKHVASFLFRPCRSCVWVPHGALLAHGEMRGAPHGACHIISLSGWAAVVGTIVLGGMHTRLPHHVPCPANTEVRNKKIVLKR